AAESCRVGARTLGRESRWRGEAAAKGRARPLAAFERMSSPARSSGRSREPASVGCIARSLRASVGEEVAVRAVTVSEYGGTPVVGEIPTPEPGAGQVLLR